MLGLKTDFLWKTQQSENDVMVVCHDCDCSGDSVLVDTIHELLRTPMMLLETAIEGDYALCNVKTF